MARLSGVPTSAPVLATDPAARPAPVAPLVPVDADPTAVEVPDGAEAGARTPGLETVTGPGVAGAPPAVGPPGALTGKGPAGGAPLGPPEPPGPAGAPPGDPPADPGGAVLRPLPLPRPNLLRKFPLLDPVSLSLSSASRPESSSESSSSDDRTSSASRSSPRPSSRSRAPGGQSSSMPCSSSGSCRGSQQGSPGRSVGHEGRRRSPVCASAWPAQAPLKVTATASHIGTRMSLRLSNNRPRLEPADAPTAPAHR
jgi:hypothetical protein